MKRGAGHLQAMEAKTREIARVIGPAFDQFGALFALLTFTEGAGGFASYVSNADRDDMIRALREMADKLERGEDMPPIRPGEPSA